MVIFENVQFCKKRVLFTSLLQSGLRKWGQYRHMNKADNSGCLHAPVGYCAKGV